MDVFSAIVVNYGYLGIFILMLLESASFPIPSEVILPAVGLLSREGLFNVHIAFIISVMGSIIGALADFYIAKWVGKEFVYSKASRLRLLSHLHKAEKFLDAHAGAVLFARFIPAIRALISIPAGLAEMNIYKFITYSLAGIMIYNALLIYAFNYFVLPLMIGIGIVMTGLYLYMFVLYDIKHR